MHLTFSKMTNTVCQQKLKKKKKEQTTTKRNDKNGELARVSTEKQWDA